MTSSTAGRVRRGTARLAASALAVGGLAAVGATTIAAPAQAATTDVTQASFTWGLSGYAQKGIFGPWTFKDLSGNATQLVGGVSGGSQTEYVAQPVPATSMPATNPAGQTPNAVRFTAGTGTADLTTGAVSISWTGSYTVNAYPAQFNAPNEVYSDPQLTLDAEGDGQLTMNFTLGAGVDQLGNPTPATDLGRVPLMRFDDGVAATGLDSFRLTPEYQGVELTLPEGQGTQTRDCVASESATGWWGSWPQEFVTKVPASVRPHFYSTGCSGNQDLKPALPADLDLHLAPEVKVSDTTLLPSGAQLVTVTGSGFDPSKATGTRPPLAGQPAGAYVVFGKFATAWRPSAGIASGERKSIQADQQWVTPGGVAPGTATLKEDGTFSVTVKVDKAALDAGPAAGFAGNYGIYTYPGSGAVEPSFETYTPLTFAKAAPAVSVTSAGVTYGAAASAVVKVAAEGGATGAVTVRTGSTTLGSADLAGGTATVPLGTLPAGTHTLTASYAGSANVEAGTATATLVVAKAGSTTKVTVTKKPRAKRAGRAKITVTSPSGAVAGSAKVVLKNAAGKTVKGVEAGAVKNGRATVTLPKLAKGRYTLVVTYVGDANVTGSSKKVTVKVA